MWNLSQTAPSLPVACRMVSDRKLGGACMGMRLGLGTIFSLQQGTICSIVPRPTQSQLFDYLQHGKGLGNFCMSDMNC